jgi:glycosyltransferase involved in cell wall biosynthesis
VRVQALISGRNAASSRFRVLQHVRALGALGITVIARPPRISKYASVPAGRSRAGNATLGAALSAAKVAVRVPAAARSWRADATWLEREVLPGRLTLEPLLHRPLFFDVDDAVWLLSAGHERATRAIAARATCVLAGNDYLAEWFSPVAGAVERVWTAIDTERFTPGGGGDRPFTIGWTGSGSSMRYLQSISPALARVLAEVPAARLVVVSDALVELPGVDRERVDFVAWSPDVEAEALRRMDVGLMPLGRGEWAKGKCAFKMLQYLSCGVPAVVSPVGMNAQVLAMADVGLAAADDDGWVDAVLALHRDPARARTLGANGRTLMERSFSIPVIAAQLASAMRRFT